MTSKLYFTRIESTMLSDFLGSTASCMASQPQPIVNHVSTGRPRALDIDVSDISYVLVSTCKSS
jgi:hypothetical protein